MRTLPPGPSCPLAPFARLLQFLVGSLCLPRGQSPGHFLLGHAPRSHPLLAAVPCRAWVGAAVCLFFPTLHKLGDLGASLAQEVQETDDGAPPHVLEEAELGD